MPRKLVSSGSPLEPEIGFSRAVRIGPLVSVSGTAPIKDDGKTASVGDLYGQTLHCLEIVKAAIEDAGASLDDVIRTRVMLTDISAWREAARAHGDYFRNTRPACTFFEVSRFIDESWLVEVEADAVIE
ncbi:MAG: RidA family protein [Gammaproteobacteria bacterium]|nr:RidA family protein [Gammaproteobacteria bacterium]